MKHVAYILPPDYHGNRVFNVQDPVLNRDDCLRSLHLLREHLLGLGVSLDTNDITPPDKADAILMENAPTRDAVAECARIRTLGKPMLLNASESIFVLPANADPLVHASFDRVFTFQDDLVNSGNPKYQKFNYTFTLPECVGRGDPSSKRLLCCVAGNKRNKHNGELYSERVRVIRWYERNHPSDFDLYGIGWDRCGKAAETWVRRKLFPRPFTSWCGAVENKGVTMEQYRFALCFENAADVSGYITEKMFDAMIAGCVPIYRGAGNVADHVPPDCFIDYRDFDSLVGLYHFISEMPSARHEEHLKAVEAFFTSRKADSFRHPFFVNTIGRAICDLLAIPFVSMEEDHYA